jgi:uroporphyrinogen decarboxylase
MDRFAITIRSSRGKRNMNSRERMLWALKRGRPDRLPVTTHHVMDSFRRQYLGGASAQDFFERFGLDGIQWVVAHRPDGSKGEFRDPLQGPPGFLEAARVASEQWRVFAEALADREWPATRYRFVTPGGELSMVLRSSEQTSWVAEPLIKNKTDIELIAKHVTAPKCDVQAINAAAGAYGGRGLTRGHICTFDVFGQPGTWQDAACLVGTERLIMETHDDPLWVHALLEILQKRKLVYTRSLQGAAYDLLELGGGDASSTVISPKLFDEFVAPYDGPIIDAAHEAGQRIVYHTCGGMMPFLERIAEMRPDAMETFTPRGMGGDVDLAAAKRRVGERVCMIGGFDQFHFFAGCTPAQTRAEVRRCFEAAGQNGGYILSPSDHFFDADVALIEAFADEARKCVYA